MTTETAKVLKCTCKHAFQDKEYGNGMRVHNLTIKEDRSNGKHHYRCTVCGNSKTA